VALSVAGCFALGGKTAQAADLEEQLVAWDSIPTVIVSGSAIASGPAVSATGANAYGMSAADILNSPAGANATLTDVLTQMPGVAIDQNQQIHIRNTEGPQFQYQINGMLVPLDINTNPPFLSMINPLFVAHLDLLDGILPASYSYATGGVIDIRTKDGCQQPGGSATLYGGQRGVAQPSAQYGGCLGEVSYYVSGLYSQGNDAFSSATPGPNPLHDQTNQGQAFGYFSYKPTENTKLSLVTSFAKSDNQLPNIPGLAPQFALAGAGPMDSGAINSTLNFSDALVMVGLSAAPSDKVSYQLSYAAHEIVQEFRPDVAGELIFQGVASHSRHRDLDNTLQGDFSLVHGDHTLGTGFYAGAYEVQSNLSSQVFAVDANGNPLSSVPVRIDVNSQRTNYVAGLYIDDVWRLTDWLKASYGVRADRIIGYTNGGQVDPTLNLTAQLDPATTLHAGYARYMQAPEFQGIAPTAPAAFAGTTAAGSPGATTPVIERDDEWDAGLVYRLTSALTISVDGFYERTHHYLDTGQFGVVPIFAPFNYDRGKIWGTELALSYRQDGLSAYANLTVGRNTQKGVTTGQFNFDADELAYIDSRAIVLDHQPLAGVSSGASYSFGPYGVSADLVYSSGLRGGFADTQTMPTMVQVNAALQRSFTLPGIGPIINRLTLLNLFDRTNLIRPAQGIGIFQAAYGPRFTIFDGVTISF
jgi:hypothetical protein